MYNSMIIIHQISINTVRNLSCSKAEPVWWGLDVIEEACSPGTRGLLRGIYLGQSCLLQDWAHTTHAGLPNPSVSEPKETCWGCRLALTKMTRTEGCMESQSFVLFLAPCMSSTQSTSVNNADLSHTSRSVPFCWDTEHTASYNLVPRGQSPGDTGHKSSSVGGVGLSGEIFQRREIPDEGIWAGCWQQWLNFLFWASFAGQPIFWMWPYNSFSDCNATSLVLKNKQPINIIFNVWRFNA